MPNHYVEVEAVCDSAESRLIELASSAEFYGELATQELLGRLDVAFRDGVGSDSPDWAEDVLRAAEVRYEHGSLVLYSGNLTLHQALTEKFSQEVRGRS